MQISSQSLRYQATRLLGAVGGDLIDSPVAQGGLVLQTPDCAVKIAGAIDLGVDAVNPC